MGDAFLGHIRYGASLAFRTFGHVDGGRMHLSHMTRHAYAAMAACVVVAGVYSWFIRLDAFTEDMLFTNGIHAFTFACYAAFLVIWLRLVRHRLVDRRVRSLMMAAGYVMLAGLFVRTLRFEFTDQLIVLSRYLWYAYYVGFAFVPTLLLLAVLHIGKRDDEAIDRRFWLLLVGAGLLVALVFTNDFHQLAFRFSEGTDVWLVDDSTPYRHGPVFYAAMAWLALSAFAGISVALARSVRAPRLSASLVPLGIVALGALHSILCTVSPVFARMVPIKTTELDCILTVSYMESLVVLGLFPVNEHYGELWRASTLRGALMDSRGDVAYEAQGAPRVSEAQVREALERPVDLADDAVLVARRVSGGISYWVRDVGQVRALQARLEELGDTLSEQNVVLAAENDLAHERSAVAQRQALYDAISKRTQPQLARLSALLDDVPADDDAFLATMHRAAVEAAYLKRCANLTLAGDDGMVDVRELALAVEESAQWLRSCGVDVRVCVTGEGMVDAEEALRSYEDFHRLAGLAADDAGADRASLVCTVGTQGIEAQLTREDAGSSGKQRPADGGGEDDRP